MWDRWIWERPPTHWTVCSFPIRLWLWLHSYAVWQRSLAACYLHGIHTTAACKLVSCTILLSLPLHKYLKKLLNTRFAFLGRLLWVDLITLVGLKCPCVRLSTKSFFDFSEIWYVGRGRRVMHDGMQYDPIRGQGQGHEPMKVGISTIFKDISSPIYNGGWQVTMDSWIRGNT